MVPTLKDRPDVLIYSRLLVGVAKPFQDQLTQVTMCA